MYDVLARTDRRPGELHLRFARPEGGVTFMLPVTLEGALTIDPNGVHYQSVYVVPLYVHLDADGTPLGFSPS